MTPAPDAPAAPAPMRILTADDLRQALDFPACIEAMRKAFLDVQAGHYFMPVRSRVRPEEGGNWMTLMPCMRRSAPPRWALKQMVVTPANARRGLDPLQGAVLLHDGETGALLAMADVPALTTLRTAAVTALATRTLAPARVDKIAIVGLGVQGRSHVQALRAVYPEASLHVWGRTAGTAAAYAEQHGCTVEPTIRDALRDADVVCTVTASHEPIAERRWFKPGCHVNAVGSSTPAARELDGPTLAAAELLADRREAALAESGDILGALREQAMTPAHIQAELGEVLAGRHPGRRGEGSFTIFKSLGFGAQDLAAIELALDRAVELGLGREFEFQS